MGLKPVVFVIFKRFTSVNGNINLNNFNFVGFILPPALADGSYKLLHFLALAAF